MNDVENLDHAGGEEKRAEQSSQCAHVRSRIGECLIEAYRKTNSRTLKMLSDLSCLVLCRLCTLPFWQFDCRLMAISQLKILLSSSSISIQKHHRRNCCTLLSWCRAAVPSWEGEAKIQRAQGLGTRDWNRKGAKNANQGATN